jgi:hypothetical protein
VTPPADSRCSLFYSSDENVVGIDADAGILRAGKDFGEDNSRARFNASFLRGLICFALPGIPLPQGKPLEVLPFEFSG